MANIQGKSNQNKFKKALATLEQAGRMSLAKNDFSYGDVNKECGGDEADYCSDNLMNDFNSDNQTICKIMETSLKGANYLAPYDWNGNTNVYQNITSTAETKIIGGKYHSFGKNTTGKGSCSAAYGYYLLPDGAVVGVSIGNTGIRLSLPCSVKAGEKFDSHWINNHDTWTTTSDCLGFIDVNGPNGPNKEVECSDGVETTNEVENPCVVKTKDITDMFPIAFHDATVEPASNAAMYVFRHAK